MGIKCVFRQEYDYFYYTLGADGFQVVFEFLLCYNGFM